MSMSTCPIASVQAPLQRAWSLLAEPANFAQWWDARTEGIEPEGPAQPGQRIHGALIALGIRGKIDVLVESVDESRHALDLKTTLPFGITVFNHIRCSELDARSCRISFG